MAQCEFDSLVICGIRITRVIQFYIAVSDAKLFSLQYNSILIKLLNTHPKIQNPVLHNMQPHRGNVTVSPVKTLIGMTVLQPVIVCNKLCSNDNYY